MAMNGGIYDKACAPLGLYIEDGKQLTPVQRPAIMTLHSVKIIRYVLELLPYCGDNTNMPDRLGQ